MQKNRLLFVDILKIIASYLVVVNHTILPSFTTTKMSLTWLSGVIIFTLSKIAVPLYLIVSGYLMFQKEITIQMALSKFKKMALIFTIGTIIHYISYYVLQRDPIRLSHALYAEEITNIYWYMFLYLGILLIAPVLSVCLNTLSIKLLAYMIFLNIIFVSTIPIILQRLSFPPINPNFSAVFLYGPIIYILIGHLLYRLPKSLNLSTKYTKISMLIFLISWLFFIGLILSEELRQTTFTPLFWDKREAVYVIFLSVSFFILIGNSFPKISNHLLKTTIIKLSQASFFILLFSDLVMFFCSKIGLNFFIINSINQLFIRQIIFSLVIFTLTISIGLVFYHFITIFKKINIRT